MAPRLYLGSSSSGDAVPATKLELKADRLTTHGVIVGMTGSGKTGLGLVLLEELLRQDVPLLAVDPKGDLANLALLFPEYRAEDFEPWVEDKADAQKLADVWRNGTAASGLTTETVRALKEKAEITVLTPGSRAGTPVNLLGALTRPSAAEMDDLEVRTGLVQSTVSGLLGLTGLAVDPVRDPAHIVLSRILDDAWDAGESPDLETLILRLCDPPFEKVGVFPLEKFLPADERMEIAMALNAVVASPSFAAWKEGVPLDFNAFLDRSGKTKATILSIAHLDDTQRTFFLSIFLGKLLAHTRKMSGTSELRALLYFDEVAGYLPPHPKNPPTKQPLLTMMKQARAVGVGVMLSTQNPVDLDYKALSNAGVWCIGRLQTQQDRDRLLKGMGRTDLDDVVESLGKREFVLFDAKEDEPSTFKTRFAMCFLRGPFTRKEQSQLRDSGLVTTGAARASAGAPAAPAATSATGLAPTVAATSAARPPDDSDLFAAPPPGLDAFFLDDRVVGAPAVATLFKDALVPAREDGNTVYAPALYCDAMLHFDEDRIGFATDRRVRRIWFPLQDGFGDPQDLPLPDSAFFYEAPRAAKFPSLPAFLDEEKELKAAKKRVFDDLYRQEKAGAFVHKKLKIAAKADESREAFEDRVRAAAARDIEDDLAKLHERYQKKADKLDERIAKAEAKLVDLQGALSAKQSDELVNVGASIFSMFTGRGLTKSKVTRAMKRRTQSSRASQRVEAASDKLDRLREDAADLVSELEDKIADVEEQVDEAVDAIEDKEVGLEKNDIRIDRFGILWVPISRPL